MKNKLKRTLCALLAPCIVLLNGCKSNEARKNDIENEIYRSELNPDIKNKTYENVSLFIARDEINKVDRYYFVTLDKVYKERQEDDIFKKFIYETSEQNIPLEILEKSEIESYVGEFKSIIDENVRVFNIMLRLENEEGYNYGHICIEIIDETNNLKISQLMTCVSLNDEPIFTSSIYLTGNGKTVIENVGLSIDMLDIKEKLTYEEILEYHNYYNKRNEDNKNNDQNILKRI